nr:GGDEF domain-containing protein [Thiomonas sp. FB-Cd]
MASRDSLTSLWNRRRIEVLLSREIQRTVHSGAPLTIMLADLDHFKGINDSFGHATGDEVPRHVGSIIHSTLRAGAEVGRWGGEEFLIVLPDTSIGDALACAKLIHEPLASTGFNMPERFAVTVSLGLAAWSSGETFPAFFSRADHAMYEAKIAGRTTSASSSRHGRQAWAPRLRKPPGHYEI